jgi:hypothetical protein
VRRETRVNVKEGEEKEDEVKRKRRKGRQGSRRKLKD